MCRDRVMRAEGAEGAQEVRGGAQLLRIRRAGWIIDGGSPSIIDASNPMTPTAPAPLSGTER